MDDRTTYCYGCLPPSFQSTGWSALFFSVEGGDVSTTKSLLKAGANVALKDKVPFDMCGDVADGVGFCEFLPPSLSPYLSRMV